MLLSKCAIIPCVMVMLCLACVCFFFKNHRPGKVAPSRGNFADAPILVIIILLIARKIFGTLFS